MKTLRDSASPGERGTLCLSVYCHAYRSGVPERHAVYAGMFTNGLTGAWTLCKVTDRKEVRYSDDFARTDRAGMYERV